MKLLKTLKKGDAYISVYMDQIDRTFCTCYEKDPLLNKGYRKLPIRPEESPPKQYINNFLKNDYQIITNKYVDPAGNLRRIYEPNCIQKLYNKLCGKMK